LGPIAQLVRAVDS